MSDKKTVLLVEDNPDILWTNSAKFTSCGYSVLTAESLRDARAILKETPVDAIVLDIMLPDGNGLDFIPEIRRLTAAPVLLLTALSEGDERIAGLKAGGDDYICKPYNIDELVARVYAFLRREAVLSASLEIHSEKLRTITCGSIELDTVALRAFLGGNDMMLSPKEFSVLRLLMMKEGETLGAEHLYEEVWKQPMNDDNNALKSVIKRLRKKMEGSGYTIRAEYSEGYRFERGGE